MQALIWKKSGITTYDIWELYKHELTALGPYHEDDIISHKYFARLQVIKLVSLTS